MKNNRFTSTADRKWQRRYEAIVQRKEENWEYDRQKKQKRMERKIVHTKIVPLDFTNLDGHTMPAILCTSREKARHLLNEAARQGLPNIWASPDDCWHYYEENTVYVFPRDRWGGKNILHADVRTANLAGCYIIPYEDLLPPPDYGDIGCVSELSMLFV